MIMFVKTIFVCLLEVDDDSITGVTIFNVDKIFQVDDQLPRRPLNYGNN